MNRRTVWLLSIILIAFSNGARGGKTVTLCHVPPGNPANRQTISVGEAAVRAHLAHGDEVGACTDDCASRCNDGNLCTSDSCDATGQCAHAAVSCDDGFVCTLDLCDPAAGCLRLANDGVSCNDGNDCTSADACNGTECRGRAIAGCCALDPDCDDGDPCSDDVCFLGSCRNPLRDCAVESKCLAGYCDAKAGGACATTEVSCDDSNVCTDDLCDSTFGCTHLATTSPPELAEISCADTTDNDCDGAVDSADPDCYRCGDGVVQAGEECDDGNDNPFDGCDSCVIVDTNPG